MNSSKIYSEYAELALATYSDFYHGMSQGAYEDALKQGGKGMSLTQAQDFAASYTVIDQYTDLSGVSATIFEGRDGKRHLAIRGTGGFGDINADCILAQGFPSYLNPQFVQLRGQIDTWLANGDLTSGFSVTGHSLGGYLAVAVGTWYSGQVGQTYTYNAPGLGGLAGNIFDAFRAVFGFSDAALIPDAVNLRGSAGISVISGLGAQLSPPVLIETEFSLNPFENHSIARLADSLAVYNLFATIDPSLSVGVIGGILQSSTPSSSATLESAVSGLGQLLVQGFVPRADNYYDSNQDNLYADIKGIASAVSGHSGMSLVPFGTVAANGTYTVFSSTEIQSHGRNDVAHRYVLLGLNSFATFESLVAA